MLNIEFKDKVDQDMYDIIDREFEKYAINNNLTCSYDSFCFVAKENDKVIGILTGHSYYNEVHINDFIILEEYRNKGIGREMMDNVEKHFKDKNFDNLNLSTYAFQAPLFYQKCGFKVEYIRENKKDPKLNKIFLIKNI